MLKQLKQDLEEVGYLCSIRDDGVLVCGVGNGWSELLNCVLLTRVFGITLGDDTYILDYTRAQLSEIENFKNRKKLIDFVQKVKPIEK